MARKIRSISLNPKMLEDIDRGCAFRGWSFSRWLEEAAKFQIMADRKAMKAAATKEIKPQDINFEDLPLEDFQAWMERLGNAARERATREIIRNTKVWEKDDN